jgi:outer membrane protein assembly factor BamB
MGRRSHVLLCGLLVGCGDPGGVVLPPGRITPASLLEWRDSSNGFNSRPAIGDTAVYVLSAIAPVGTGTTTVHTVSAFRKTNGAMLWRTTLPVTDPSRVGYGVMLVGNTLVVGDGDVFGIDPSDGMVRWTYVPSVGRFPGYFFQSTDGSTVYAGGSHVFAIDAATGAEKWVAALGSEPNLRVPQTIVKDGVVYAAFSHTSPPSSDIGGVVALNATTGLQLWMTKVEPLVGSSISTIVSIAITNTRVLAAAHATGVLGFDRTTGVNTDTVYGSSLVLSGQAVASSAFYVAGGVNTVFVGSSLGVATALDANTHAVRWRVGGGSISSFTVDDTLVAVGRVGAFELRRVSDGTVVWQLGPRDLRSDGEEGGLWSPALDATHVYLGGAKEVFAFRKK